MPPRRMNNLIVDFITMFKSIFRRIFPKPEWISRKKINFVNPVVGNPINILLFKRHIGKSSSKCFNFVHNCIRNIYLTIGSELKTGASIFNK